MRNAHSIITAHEAVAIYFQSPSCGVCKSLLPKLQKLFETEFSRIKFEIVDLEKEPNIAAELNVFSAATILVFFDKKEYVRYQRAFGIDQLAFDVSRIYELFF